jgi:pyrophosphatase PpaX
MIRAVLFDQDGVVIDSNEAKLTATAHALRTQGVTPDPEAIRPHMHKLEAVRQSVAPHLSYPPLLAAYREKLTELAHTIAPYKETRSLFEWLRQQGILIGIVSSSETTEEVLRKHGLRDMVDAVVSGLDNTASKPAPEPVLLALKRLRIQPTETIMVGDLPADIQAAKAAGLAAAVGITHGFGTEEMLQEAGADYIIASLGELPRTLENLRHAAGLSFD